MPDPLVTAVKHSQVQYSEITHNLHYTTKIFKLGSREAYFDSHTSKCSCDIHTICIQDFLTILPTSLQVEMNLSQIINSCLYLQYTDFIIYDGYHSLVIYAVQHVYALLHMYIQWIQMSTCMGLNQHNSLVFEFHE